MLGGVFLIKSMTGFGRGEAVNENRNITVEIKSVNHRYCDISCKMPRVYSFAEDSIKKAVKKQVKRGKSDVYVTIQNLLDGDVDITLNKETARQYYDNLKLLKEEFEMEEEISLQYLASLPDVLKSKPKEGDEEELTRLLIEATAAATEELDNMRLAEGEKLAQDLMNRASVIKELVDKIRDRAPLVPVEHREKLMNRIQELLDGTVEIPEDRILVEAAIYADKCNIDEELTRLYSHMDQLADILRNSNGPCGKKLDFLVQEMNREANTIGSKANDLEITENMLKIKAEVEKIREQVQNIE